jgi:hypothetical protein
VDTADVSHIVYVESNIAQPDKNSILVIRYHSGDISPIQPISSFPTGGSGSSDLTDSGVLDADQQVIVNADRTLLFAVNQGSDTIAVFHILSNGDLEAVDGSPFPSGGKGPASLGLVGDTLVVANKAQDGIRDLSTTAPNYTSFTVQSSGALEPVTGSTISLPEGSSPTHALALADDRLIIGTEEAGPLVALRVDAEGRLAHGPNSPLDPDSEIFGSGFPAPKEFALGLGAVPSSHLLYIAMPTVPALATYSYSASGRLRFISSVPVAGSFLPCWVQITQDGRWLYTSNAATDSLTVFDIHTNQVRPRQIQTVALEGPGNPWNIKLDPSDGVLFSLTPRDTLSVPLGEGNTLHALTIGSDGKLTETSSSPLKLPVPPDANPQGLAVIPGQSP